MEYKNILALKQMGFSLDEMRQMTMRQFIAITDLAAGPDEISPEKKASDAPRKATQADIDRLLF